MVRYEDLVRRPRETIERILTFEGALPLPADLGFVDGHRVSLGVDHTVAGNPMRFQHGTFDLKMDEAWRGSMESGQRILATAMTWPLLAAYGYRVGRRRHEPPTARPAALDVQRCSESSSE